MAQRSGQLIQTDFMENVGGLNISDSVFRVATEQATGGLNYDYTLTGGIKKRLGALKLNTVADTQLQTLGFGLYNTTSGNKTVMRAAGTKLQTFVPDPASFTALSQDTLAAPSDPFTSGSTQTVSFSQFNNGTAEILWGAGGGASRPIGAYSTTKFTENGVTEPAGAIVATRHAAGGGSFATTGDFSYAVVYRKASTQALSNASLDTTATVQVVTDKVTIDLTGLTGLDTTLIDQIWIYRSTVNGGEGFTTGDLIAQLASTVTSYDDQGTSILESENIPRENNTVLDNSQLPSGTYNTITLFKRRLVTASGSTLFISEINKSESWPTENDIQIPSGGDITGLAVISFTSPQAQTLDEILVIFKEREMWVVTGNSFEDWVLKFIDQVGCPDQSLAVLANGFLCWIDFRGIYLWDGSSKPIYCSRPIEPLFARDGDLDKTRLVIGHGEFFRKENHIMWFLSSKTYGTQKFSIKMDLRLTLPKIEQTMTGRNIEGVFIQDTYSVPIYAAMSYIPDTASDEQMLMGDASGFCYYASRAYSDGSSAFNFRYKTKALDMDNPNTNKQFHKVIAWVNNIGDWDLTLDYWSNYSVGTAYQATKSLPLSSSSQLAALWDIAVWDVSLWDDYESNVVPIVFNLEPGVANSNQGTALQIQFRNDNADEPISIHGFSVFWSEMGGLTA